MGVLTLFEMKHTFQKGQAVRTSRKIYGKTEQHEYIPENTPGKIEAIYYDHARNQVSYAVRFDQQEYGEHTLLESSLTDGEAIATPAKSNGLERFFAPVDEIINFVEWMADQPCTDRGAKRCRDTTDDPTWCCQTCRAALLRYGHEFCKAPIPGK